MLPAGLALGPASLGVLASLAVAQPLVYRRPRVSILGSGDEIVDVDQPEEILSGRKIASSNTHTLMALVRQAGGEPAHTVTISELPQHLHTLNASKTTGNQNNPSFSGVGNILAQEPGNPYSNALSPSAASLNPASVSSVGGSQPHNNLQPYLVLNYIIALQGVFPSQN